jgi:Fur family peroxide stress response transcriptional regulator
MVARLQTAGHRLTSQRLAVVRVLASTTAHPSVEQLHAAALAQHSGVGLATVYNTLDLLQALGEVLVLDFGEGFKRYDGRCPRPHAHLVCAACGRVDDVDGVDLANLPLQVAGRTGYRLLEHRFDLRGLCPDCQSETAT